MGQKNGERGKNKKRSSIRKKLIIIFGLLIALALLLLGLLAIRIAQKAVTEKVKDSLINKANDTAEIVDSRINTMFRVLEGMARQSFLRDNKKTYFEKVRLLREEAEFYKIFREVYLIEPSGMAYFNDGSNFSYAKDEWFIETKKGKRYITEPFYDSSIGNLFVIGLSVPVYDNKNNIIGILYADTKGEFLTEQIKDIVVGKTGGCYIVGSSGNTIADPDFSTVTSLWNSTKEAANKAELQSVADIEQKVLHSAQVIFGTYFYKGVVKISAGKRMQNGWAVIIFAPIEEFMGTIATLRKTMVSIGFAILITMLLILFFVALRIVKPINTTVQALRNIAQGDGDLTVRLPLKGNDEITDLAEYFNQTIAKMGKSIKTVGKDTYTMENIATELASNMSETASAVQQISANIDGVKKQAFTQAASVTETAATVEEVIETIRQLNGSIENQASSVAESSSAVERMVANIASITKTLEQTNSVIKELSKATNDGKNTVNGANAITQKVAEESGGLLKASSVIQHIASQTNLLAMNAAIEAAHAGDAGKGFAVVADEIRKLAEESSTQGKNITTTLKNLSGEITELSASSRTAEEKFNVIFHLSEQVQETSSRLMEAMRAQQSGSSEVLEAIKDINEVTACVNDSSAEMLKGSENVAAEMQKLDNLTRAITDSMNEMASGAVQISNAVQEVNEITQKNKASIDSLAEEVDKFKV